MYLSIVFYDIYLALTNTNHNNVTHDFFSEMWFFFEGFPLFCFPQRFMAAILTVGYYEVALWAICQVPHSRSREHG